MLPSIDAPMSRAPLFTVDYAAGRRKHEQLGAMFKQEEQDHAHWAAGVNRTLAAWHVARRSLERVEPLLSEVR